MGSEQLAGLVALGWLVAGLVVMTRSIRRGRELAEALATRHPETYEALGRPRPGYLQSLRADRFAQFVARREFERLADPVLSARFEEYRRSDARIVLSLLASLLLLCLFVFAVKYAA